MGPFALLEPAPPGWLGRPPRRNAWVELHNLLAAATSPREFGPSDRERIGRRHGVDLAHAFLPERLAFYAAYLRHLLAGGDLTGEERAELAHVARTLGLEPAQLVPVHERAFGRVAVEAVADAQLSVEQRLLLYKLQHALGLDPALAGAAYDVLAADRLRALAVDALADGTVTDDEAAELDHAAASLSAPLPPDTAPALADGRARWTLRAGSLPVLPHAYAPLSYRRGEKLHYVARVRYRRIRTVYLRTHKPGKPLPRVALGVVSEGTVAVTSARLAFVSPGGRRHYYPLAEVREVRPFEGGLLVVLGGGSSFLFTGGADVPTLHVAIDRARGARPAPTPPPLDPPAAPPVADVPAALKLPLEPGETAHLVTRATCAAFDLLRLRQGLRGKDRARLDAGQTQGLKVRGRGLLVPIGVRWVVVTDRRVILKTPGWWPVSIRYVHLTRALCFADAVALEAESTGQGGTAGWLFQKLDDPAAFYTLTTRFWSAG